MSCDVGEVTKKVGEWALLNVAYVCMSSAHSPTFPSLHLRHNSFSNPSVALPTSQLILQSSFRYSYITAHSPTLPLLHLRHSSFSYPSFASPTSHALHLIHLASRPWWVGKKDKRTLRIQKKSTEIIASTRMDIQYIIEEVRRKFVESMKNTEICNSWKVLH